MAITPHCRPASSPDHSPRRARLRRFTQAILRSGFPPPLWKASRGAGPPPAFGLPAVRAAIFISISLLLPACEAPLPVANPPTATPATSVEPSSDASTPLPTRVPLVPGQIMEYTVQSGDTLEAVAVHFHSSVEEIRRENPDLPRRATTLEPGLLLRVPSYYAAFSGTPFQIIPDSELVRGPTSDFFDVRGTVYGHPGYLSYYQEYAFQHIYYGWEIVRIVAQRYSIHPRLLLALLEYRTQALSRGEVDAQALRYPLGPDSSPFPGLSIQLNWVAEQLNNGYYGWTTGQLKEIGLRDGRVTVPDSYQNAGTVAVQYLMAQWYGEDDFQKAVSPDGFARTYRALFGDPFQYRADLMPGGLEQPAMQLPFEAGRVWAFTGGPHPAWGDSLPWGAIDFAPPSITQGCVESGQWITAVADGIVVRSEPATVVLDLDLDGNENTGWNVIYFHVGEIGRSPLGALLKKGGLVGHPSCEGGQATGSHVHMARKYNGVWIPAAGPLAFNLSGWVVWYGDAPYEGTLHYFTSMTLIACPSCVNKDNQLSLAPETP